MCDIGAKQCVTKVLIFSLSIEQKFWLGSDLQGFMLK